MTLLVFTGCGTVPVGTPASGVAADGGPPRVIYVIRRSWHTDIGFNAADLPQAFATVRTTLPSARYLLFGFGDRHYLVNKGRHFGAMLGAIWPGPGVMLVTGLGSTPEEAFGEHAVVRLILNSVQRRSLEAFIWNTLATRNDVAHFLGPGPYDGSAYYASTVQYSGVNTCNTWTASALKAAGLPVSSFGVEFSGQVWRQVRALQRQQAAASTLPPPAVPAHDDAR